MTQSDSNPPPPYTRPVSAKTRLLLLALWAACSLGMAAGFVAYTGQVWEDFFITFKFSQNLAEGNGLTYDGETRVHGFTSVINTLVPSLFYKLGGLESWRIGLAGYQVVAALFFTGAIAFLFQSLLGRGHTEIAPLTIFGALVLLEIKIVAFAYNGQEAAFMLGFFALAWVAAFQGVSRSWLLAGLAWAGLMYTRPDSPVYIAILGLLSLCFPAAPASRKTEAVGLLKAGSLCAVAYLPWFVFVWIYYGTPIPHTITAKAGATTVDFASFLSALASTGYRAFSPIYFNPADWPAWVTLLSVVISAVTASYLFWPVRDRPGKMVSLAFICLVPYLAFLDVSRAQFPWYFPPLTFAGYFVFSRALWGGIARLKLNPVLKALSACTALALPAYLFAMATYQVKFQQEYSERVRTDVGLWLNEHAEPDESIYLECLGYIGFFSQGKMLDWPGMASPEVVQAGKAVDFDFYRTMEVLEPHWVVLRKHEFDYAFQNTALARTHDPRLLISRRVEILSHQPPAIFAVNGQIPGIGYLLMDAAFVILETKEVPE